MCVGMLVENVLEDGGWRKNPKEFPLGKVSARTLYTQTRLRLRLRLYKNRI